MSTTYGKWETFVSEVYIPQLRKKVPALAVRRLVRTVGLFGVVRERWQEFCPDAGVGAARLCRVLNGESEPEPKLDEWRCRSVQHHDGSIETSNGYRFSTEAMKAELARREQAEQMTTTTSSASSVNNVGRMEFAPYHYKVEHLRTEKRTGPSDRRKPAKRGKGRR